ncbi:hypothetical protein KFL_004600130 [Klebsormidium nitens]|uniref:Uncharacterized protein n=1 Tax=Klebsormidium nitens TaxID=105231 RepID=A0A1Y1IFJ7_KLENI|nr:hypothetical protein KFL_004600130 [Klebsormidium nitens]|eukprot:GAQ88802.1 hypothetical protein KFL_004600130 [Klebsormidium nitens]
MLNTTTFGPSNFQRGLFPPQIPPNFNNSVKSQISPNVNSVESSFQPPYIHSQLSSPSFTTFCSKSRWTVFGEHPHGL